MSSNRHLKVFKTYDEYNEYIQTQIYRTPSVFIIKENEDDENKEIHYHSHDIIVNNIREYFTIENIGDYELTLYVSSESCGVSAYGNLYYCFENSDNWQELGENEIIIPINKSVKFKGVLNKGETVGRFNINGNSVCRVYGNIMSLVYGDNFFGKTDLSGYEYVFTSLFYCCYTTLVDASELILPATTLANSCYQYMFGYCENLTSAPQLLATTLASYCCHDMFYGCTSLISAPQLLATTLAPYCYYNMFSGCKNLISASQLLATTLTSGCYYGMFEGCTSLTIAPQLLATTLASDCCYSMFKGCTSLTTAPELLATTLANYCYYNMFYDCTSLTSAPNILPATTLAEKCYQYMFYGCTSLTTAPQLLATTLASYCCHSMFQGCTSLTTAPELLATTLASNCYGNMFMYCTSLTSAPNILPATTLAESCYSSMFYGCANLTTAPQLLATILAKNCYSSMFDGCTSLISAPELPATTLADGCYQKMFCICTSLTTAPQLPATTLATYCYREMFNGCTNLTSAPQLLATTLAYACYSYMFYGCTNLTSAPELLATTLANWCYSSMFRGCNNLSKITMLATDISATNCLDNWVNGVSTSGTFVKHPFMTSLPNGINGIPYGWTVINDNSILEKPLTIENVGDNDLTLYVTSDACGATQNLELYYCFENSNDWQELDENEITIPINNSVKFKSSITKGEAIGRFNIDGNSICKVCGNAMSLVYGDEFVDKTDLSGYESVFNQLFCDCKQLVDASNLILPATTLAVCCYQYMFGGCISLTSAPQLPATTLAKNCYSGMFNGCTSLTTTPQLLSTTLAIDCYSYMFYGCTSLKTAPQLPATTLANGCYSSMFKGCTSLKTAPQLPATTLARSCYSWMFKGCTNLTEAPQLLATTLADYCYQSMFQGCTSLTEAPKLLATKLATYCYSSMFYGCKNLHYIKMLATDISAYGCLYNWVYNVSSYGTFVKHPSMISLPNGSDGVPYGWTVKNISTIIMNPLSTVINFYYSNGIYTPDYSGFLLNTVYSENEILSLTPECDILVDLYIHNDYPKEYQWTTTKSFGDVLYEFNVYDSNEATVVIKDIIIIDSGNGYYYYNVEEKEPFVEKDWFRIVSLSDNNTISLTKDIDYSINGESWEKLSANNQITVNNNDIVYFKGTKLKQQFSVSNKFNVEGNIMSLIYNNDFEGQTDLSGKSRAFYRLFYGCIQLIDASKLILPATKLAINCYNGMFEGCTSLTTTPQLLATTLAIDCYNSMFRNCTKLVTATKLLATTLATSCYESMFRGCTSLTSAPELLATTLVYGCYNYMFDGCTSLTSAPELLATTLARYCYHGMFYGCSKLNNITMLATDISASDCLDNWVYGVASKGTFTKHPQMTSLPNGTSGIPNRWTVVDYES